MDGEFRWSNQRFMYFMTVHTTGIDHHFEADPKFLHTEELWMEWLKQVADFLAERGTDVQRVKTKMKDYADLYMSKTYDEIQQEQDRAVGGDDGGQRPVGASGGNDVAGGAVSAGDPPPSGQPDSAGPAATFAWPVSSASDRPRTPGGDGGQADG